MVGARDRALCSVALAALLSLGPMGVATADPSTSPSGCRVPAVAEPLSSAVTRAPKVSITFDESLGRLTPRIIALLDRFGMRATFFVPGAEVERYPALARRLLEHGFELANHSYSHPYLTTLADKGRAELQRANAASQRATGFRPCLMRPPFGDFDQDVLDTARELDLTVVMWSAGGIDPFTIDPHAIAENALDGIGPGSIVLLHQVPQSVKALPEILKGLRARGLRSVPVTNLLRGGFERG